MNQVSNSSFLYSIIRVPWFLAMIGVELQAYVSVDRFGKGHWSRVTGLKYYDDS